jgi:hypothetical protein
MSLSCPNFLSTILSSKWTDCWRPFSSHFAGTPGKFPHQLPWRSPQVWGSKCRLLKPLSIAQPSGRLGTHLFLPREPERPEFKAACQLCEIRPPPPRIFKPQFLSVKLKPLALSWWWENEKRRQKSVADPSALTHNASSALQWFLQAVFSQANVCLCSVHQWFVGQLGTAVEKILTFMPPWAPSQV